MDESQGGPAAALGRGGGRVRGDRSSRRWWQVSAGSGVPSRKHPDLPELPQIQIWIQLSGSDRGNSQEAVFYHWATGRPPRRAN